ncbi:MAG: hypothetical protein WB714_27850, partial [Candidatus Sulfotelmatobacter sp.]
MTPILTNEAIVMPEPSNQKPSSPDASSSSSGHRSPQRTSTTENPAVPQPLRDHGQDSLREAAPDQSPSAEVFAVYGV